MISPPSDVAPPFLDLASPEFSTRSEAMRAARMRSWFAHTPYGVAVLRYREAGTLLRDRRLRQGSHAWPDINGLTGPFAAFWSRSVISQEGEAHRRLRRLAVPALSPDFIETLTPAFERAATELAEALAQAGRCEFMADFAEPFAGKAICALLGLPAADWPAIAHDASALGLAMSVECRRQEPVFDAAYERLEALAEDLITRARTGRDRKSYVARLHARFEASDGLTPQCLRDIVVISIFGGVDTTRSQLGLGMALLVEHPEQWALLRATPTLAPAAVEETIRHRPTTTWVTREAVESFTFGGLAIKAGETVHLLTHASATDPAICTDPAFDITARRKKHFGFGGGAHHCIGHQMARTDIACALKALAARLPCIALDGDPVWLPESGNTAPARLPLSVIHRVGADEQR